MGCPCPLSGFQGLAGFLRFDRKFGTFVQGCSMTAPLYVIQVPRVSVVSTSECPDGSRLWCGHLTHPRGLLTRNQVILSE